MSIKAIVDRRFNKIIHAYWSDPTYTVEFYTTTETNEKIASIRKELSDLGVSLRAELKDESTKYNNTIESLNKAVGEIPSMLLSDEDFILKVAQRVKDLEG